LCALALALLFLGASLPSPICFDAEDIQIDAGRDAVTVTGLYFYRNPTMLPLTLALHCPLPVDDAHLVPETATLTLVDEAARELETVPFARTSSELYFRLSFLPGETKRLALTYQQPIREPSVTYVLTTTLEWHAAIPEATLRVLLPPGTSLVRSTYSPDRVSVRAGRALLELYRLDFAPEKNLTVQWQDDS
jgi:hypothetical protein